MMHMKWVEEMSVYVASEEPVLEGWVYPAWLRKKGAAKSGWGGLQGRGKWIAEEKSRVQMVGMEFFKEEEEKKTEK